MGEYFILVNDTAEQFIDPDSFPEPLGIKHTAWMTQVHTSFLAYLVTESDNIPDPGREGTPDWHGTWAGHEIRLIGSTRDDYQELSDSYEDISAAVYEEMDELYDWMPDGRLDSETTVQVSSPEETRAALEDQLENDSE